MYGGRPMHCSRTAWAVQVQYTRTARAVQLQCTCTAPAGGAVRVQCTGLRRTL